MSTKALREALESLGDGGQHPTALYDAGLAELEALVKMARIIVQHSDTGLGEPSEVEAAWGMMRELAKEAP